MWVRFLEPFNYRVNARVSISYKAGGAYNVPRGCADEAIAAGKADKMCKPTRSSAVEVDDAAA
ncbi:MAG: hypothetical protein ACK4NE_00090 [Albidovulum sp.]